MRTDAAMAGDLIRPRWWWFWGTCLLALALLTAGLLITFRPVGNGQWIEVNGSTGRLTTTGSVRSATGQSVEVATTEGIVSAQVRSASPPADGRLASLTVELDSELREVAAGDSVSVRFPATSILVGVLGL